MLRFTTTWQRANFTAPSRANQSDGAKLSAEVHSNDVLSRASLRHAYWLVGATDFVLCHKLR